MVSTRSRHCREALCSSLAALLFMGTVACLAAEGESKPAYDLSKDKVLYCVGYAHLDTQWRWDFTRTIDHYLQDTLNQNFERFEKYPEYVFSFTGAVRYDMMKEYYPQRYERLKSYIAADRWYVSGSSVDEGDVNVVSPESIVRQILYGNAYFRKEFGKESVDYMLPDCFGFPGNTAVDLRALRLEGVSRPRSSPGVRRSASRSASVSWEGPDGDSVIAALDPGSYSTAIRGRVDTNPKWTERINDNGKRYGVWADYHYYGVGDMGGAPTDEDVKNYVASIDNDDSQFHVALVSSDQLYKDITAAQRERLPRYKGDMLLTEHSAGTLTSQSYMKRWNRKNELLADAAERAAVAADWLGGAAYPYKRLHDAWFRTLANQMHDILPGTSIPRGVHLLVERRDRCRQRVRLYAARLDRSDRPRDGHARRRRAAGRLQPPRHRARRPGCREDHVAARCVRGAGFRRGGERGSVAGDRAEREGLERIVPGERPCRFRGRCTTCVRATSRTRTLRRPCASTSAGLENGRYKVTIDANGDVASIVDKRESRELLREPARLFFTYERPRSFPAWNMDWADRRRPPLGVVDGKPTVRVVERGPVRVALEIEREARGSIFTQRLQLSAGPAGERLEFATEIDWQSSGCALRQAFPLTVSNPVATYNWGAGTIERGNIEPTRYEVPSHEWFDLTDKSGEYGVTVLDDSKFGSDKPADDEVRLTLLYTPAVRDGYMDQHSQDWGRHDMLYALYGHPGDWRAEDSFWQGRRVNQPLRVFNADKHAGELGSAWSLAKLEHAAGVAARVEEVRGWAVGRRASPGDLGPRRRGRARVVRRIDRRGEGDRRPGASHQRRPGRGRAASNEDDAVLDSQFRGAAGGRAGEAGSAAVDAGRVDLRP